jgi:trimeric autotransporter adhesin
VKKSRVRLGQLTIIAASIQLIFADAPPAYANPTGPQVVNGAASFHRPDARTLSVTNTPGTIINWQGFSIGAGELTRFIQQSPSSAVLNRVVGADISQIHGQLLSNGRVFLINPSGIVIGPGAMIDTAGFVASTLNMLDGDFLAGKLKFQGDSSSGSIINQGWIRTGYGGHVLLVAPQIENSGLIHTPGGEIILAAGKKLTITSLDLDGVQFEVQAPTDSVLNVGKLLADGGAVGVFAGSLRHSGEIRANSLVYDEAGRIVLKAQNEIQITAGSTTGADGRTGGAITVQSSGLTRVAGSVSAQGSAGQGGEIKLLGDQVAVVEDAAVNASGSVGGGQILVGGDYQGSNAAIQNATNTFVGSSASLRADATQSGDGGRVIVWSDDKAQFYGNLSAQGGPEGGNGGFAEVSGKQNLIFAGSANLGAPQGNLGNLLLDPLDLYVFAGGGVLYDAVNDLIDFPTNAATVSPATLAAVSGNVTLNASRYMRISDPITLTTAGQGLTATVGTYTAPLAPDPLAMSNSVPNQLDIAANITTNGGNVSLSAPRIVSFNHPTDGSPIVSTAGGAITLNATGSIERNTFGSELSLDAGIGAITANAGVGEIELGNIMGGSFTATAPSFIGVGDIASLGAINIASSGNSVSAGQMITAGGNVSVSAAFSISTGDIATVGGSVTLASTNSSISSDNIVAGSGAVTLSGTSVFADTINTTGAVALTATQGSIFATVDNSSSLTATATNAFGTQINIDSNTDLNATSISATSTGCFSFFSCPGAFIDLSAAGNVNVGTVTANAVVSGNNSLSEQVRIESSGGSIRAMSGGSQITGADVILETGQGTGGGIGIAATALNVNVDRNFTFRPNGEFNVVLNGTGPSGFTAELGIAATGLTYTGTLSRSGGGLTLNASANDTTVTISDLSIASGFDQLVFNSNPFISVGVPNGALVATSVTVPQGDTSPPVISPPNPTEPLNVTLFADGNLTVSSYTRLSSVNSLAKSTTFQSNSGDISLGTINASKDSVSVNAFGSDISITNLSTAGNVTVFSSSGDITVGLIDTTSGTGSVTLSAPAGTVKPASNSNALEVTSGATVGINALTTGESTFSSPLDVAGASVSFFSQGGAIGFANPVVANTANLVLNAGNGSTFNVTTGSTPLVNLNVTADPVAVGSGGLAQITSEAKTYAFVSDGTNFTFNAGAIPGTQFNNGALSFTATSGNVTLGNVDIGATGTLSVAAPAGSIAAGTLDGGNINLTAGTTAGAAISILTGDIGGTTRPNSVQITAGNNGFGTQRSGSIETGTISAEDVTVTTYNGNIEIGNGGIANIGSGIAPAGTVSLNANANGLGNSGTIQVGSIFGDSISLRSPNSAITTAALDATTSISAISDVSITTGTLNAPSITLVRDFFCCVNPEIVTGAIGGTRPATNVVIAGSTTTIGGGVTGDPGSAVNFGISANGGGSNGGLLTINGPITGGDGSTISLFSANTTTPFLFTTINAGTTGTVNIGSSHDIRQQNGGLGITAQTVQLTAAQDIHGLDTLGGAVNLDLIGAKSLTVNTGGDALFNANGSQLTDLSITTSASSPDTGGITIANLGGGQSFSVTDLGDFGLQVVAGTNPLNFTFNATATGIRTTGSGITTAGGNVNLTASGIFDGTTGGIATGGGSVFISASGVATTGPINTAAAGNTAGGFINLSASEINVSGNLNTGTGGSSITLNAEDGFITRSNAATITSGTSVTATAAGDIGASGAGNSLSIDSPNVTLSARAAGVDGNVFATLSGTSSLNLTADNDFSVSSDTAFSTLVLNTEGTGSGTTLSLTAPGQTFSFARPGTDLFGNPITNTFQIVSASGATPVTNATYRVLDGDLLITGPATINATNLTLQASSAGDIKLQGNAPLVLSNTTQNINNVRDLLITGDVTLSASGSQSISVNRDLIAQAQSGSVTLSAPNQFIFSGGGKIAFRGGASADEAVTVSASNSQDISTAQFGGGNVELTAGTGDRASVTVSYAGTGTQTISAGGNVQIDGGSGTSVDSKATITTATGSQHIRAEGDINLNTIGGSGTNATARIVNTGAGNQLIGESRTSCCSFFPYQTANITVKGGSGSGSFSEIVAAGPQQIYSQFGTLSVLGGSGANAYAKIASSSTSDQQIGLPFFISGFRLGALNIQGGSGAGAFAEITSAGVQRVTTNSAVAVTAGTGNGANALLQSASSQQIDIGNLTVEGKGGAGATATAQVIAATSQNIDANVVALIGGPGTDSFARITAPSGQDIDFGSLALTAGSGSGSFAKIDTAGTQSLSGGNITLTAGGVGETVVANAGAIIEGHDQQIFGGTITLNGGSGTLGSTSDAVFRNLSGSQFVSGFGSINLNGGHQHSTTGILNLGSGTQTVSGNSGINLASDAVTVPAHADAFVMIENSAATAQTITSSSGGLRLNNSGAGTVAVTSAGTQTVTSQYVEVLTDVGSTGNSTISSVGNQYIRTTNENVNVESMVVAALGSGTAKVESGASQLLEIGYPLIMQGTNGSGLLAIGQANGVNATGNSLIQAVDQNIFAGSIHVQGPSGAGATSKLSATNVQTISTVLGGLTVTGGFGDNSLATVDPVTQTILVNGPVDVTGGDGANADASIVSGGTQTILNTNGGLTLTAGPGTGSDAIISSLGAQTLTSAGNVAVSGSTGPSADAIITTSGVQTITAGGNITLTGGTASGSDAIISNIGGQQGCALLFSCGQQQTLTPTPILTQGAGSAIVEGGFAANSSAAGSILTADATQQTLSNMDELNDAFGTLEPDGEEPDITRRVPICR